MSELTTPRLALPLLAVGQAQKEITHNEALAIADLLIQPCVEEAPRDIPPDDPGAGQCWLVGPTPEGAWSGRAGALAIWTQGGWRFAAAFDGMSAWNRAGAMLLRRNGAAWTTGPAHVEGLFVSGVQVVGNRGAAIDPPAGGATVDAEARAAITAILSALSDHGLIAGDA